MGPENSCCQYWILLLSNLVLILPCLPALPARSFSFILPTRLPRWDGAETFDEKIDQCAQA